MHGGVNPLIAAHEPLLFAPTSQWRSPVHRVRHIYLPTASSTTLCADSHHVIHHVAHRCAPRISHELYWSSPRHPPIQRPTFFEFSDAL